MCDLYRYANWGVYQPGDMPEPNNLAGNEYCGVANFTELVSSTHAWGWADTACRGAHIYVCKIMREL